MPGKLLPDKLLYLGAFTLIQNVDLGEENRYVRGIPAQVSDQLYVVLGERWVNADRDQGQPHIWKPFQASVRGVLEDALEARRVDEPNPPVEVHRRQLEAHTRHLPGVLRILTLGDKLGDPRQRNLVDSAIGKPNPGSFVRSPLNLGDGGRDRDNSHRQQRPAEEVVEKTALPGFEAPQDGDVQRLLLRKNAATLQEVIQRRDLMTLARILDRADRIVHHLGGVRCRVWLSHVSRSPTGSPYTDCVGSRSVAGRRCRGMKRAFAMAVGITALPITVATRCEYRVWSMIP